MQQDRELDGCERMFRLLGHNRAILDRAVEAMSVGGAALAELGAALDADEPDCLPRVVVAVTAALEVHQATGEFLDMVACAHRQAAAPPTKYRVTCPECGAESVTEWTDVLPPGGVSPVVCSACGYMILSESEGNPVLFSDDPEQGAAACACSAATFDGRYA